MYRRYFWDYKIFLSSILILSILISSFDNIYLNRAKTQNLTSWAPKLEPSHIHAPWSIWNMVESWKASVSYRNGPCRRCITFWLKDERKLEFFNSWSSILECPNILTPWWICSMCEARKPLVSCEKDLYHSRVAFSTISPIFHNWTKILQTSQLLVK